jgi:tetratricopeptide (TPR) repeat protein
MALNREAVVRSAEKYVAKGKIDAAIREYRKVLEENPNDINTLNRVGDLYAKVSRIDEAVKLFVQIAEQYAGDGFFVKAIAIYKKIIKLDPTRLEIYERLADLYARQGLKNEARSQFQVLADYYLKHNQAASAITIHLRMAELEPDNPSHHLKLAELYQGQQLWDKAIREYKTIAEMMLERGAVDEAVQVYQRAFDVKSDDLAFITDAVMGLKDGGHVGAAGRLLAAAVQRNPQAERIVRLAGLSSAEGDGRDTVAASGPQRATPPVSRAPVVPTEPPDFDPDEFVIEVDEDVPSTLVAPPAGMGEGPGFGFRASAAEDEASFELELEAEPASAILELPQAEEEAPARQELEEEIEIELELDDFQAELASFEQEAAPLEEVELGQAPELPGLGGAAFEIEDVRDVGGGPEAGPVFEEVPALDENAFELDLEIETAPDELYAAASGEIELPSPEPLPEPTPPFEAPSVELEAPPVELEEPELELEVPSFELEPPALELEGPTPILEPSVDLEEVASAREVELELEVSREDELELASPGADSDAAALAPTPADVAPLVEAPVEAPAVAAPSLVDLLAEAEVFAKYGLEEKALDRIARIVSEDPDHLAARCLEVEVLLKLRDDQRLAPAVARTAELAREVGDENHWPRVVQRLERAGYVVTDGRLSTAAPVPKKPDRIADLLGGLGLGTAPKPRRPAAAEASVESLLGELGVTRPSAPRVRPVPAPAPAAEVVPTGAVEEPSVAEAAPQPTEAVAEATPAAEEAAPQFADPTLPLPRYDEEAFDDELPDIVLPERKSAAKGAAAEALAAIDQVGGAAPAAADDGLDWLDEPGPGGSAGSDSLFDDEDEFFDLAAELEQELDRDDVLVATGAGTPEEPSLEDIVEGFKKGVAEHLSEEDYDTHYNLGIAYREMGLIDEAIGEFQLSAKSPDLFVDSCAMLGLCFVEKGLPDLAIKWYQRAVAHPGNSEETSLGLLYDLGSIYLNIGDDEAAYKTFVEIYGVNSNYRDVVALLEELKPQARG